MRYVLSLITALALSSGTRACDIVGVPFVQPFVSVQGFAVAHPFVSVQAFSVPVVSSFAIAQPTQPFVFQQQFGSVAVRPVVFQSRTVFRQGLLGRSVIRSRTVIR